MSSSGLIRNLIIVCVLLLLVSALLIGVYVWERERYEYPELDDFEEYGSLSYDGKLYEERKDVMTVLFIGVDSPDGSAPSVSSYNNDYHADFLMLMAIDRTNKRYSAIHINRDAMADVTVLGVGGKTVGVVNEQIALSHTYGSGGQDSCRNVLKSVSSLLFGVNIDHYISVAMSSVPKINDAIGGVTLTVLDDFSSIDESLVQGKEVTLNGAQALCYVRSRAGLENSSNLARMARQRQYLDSAYNAIEEKKTKDADFVDKLAKSLFDVTTTDFDVAVLQDILDTVMTYDRGEIYSLEGESSVSDGFIQFHVDEQKAKKLVIELLYKES